jgi:outer membrane protein assembly factor BamB
MAITNAKTPINVSDTTLLWNRQLGSGWGAAPSVQIIVDDALIVMSSTSIYKLDLETGAILATGTMSAAPNFGYTPPTYAEGMIFCPLTDGTVQAFNAETLESVWIYQDALGGQSQSPITYSDGYIYTGFWNSETKDANFVCLSVTDEDPSSTAETKLASWKHTQPGGFYWAGSVVVGDWVIVGTDDGASGTSGNSELYSFNKKTGQIVSCLELTGAGDQRSSIAYDAASGKVYFTTKGAICSARRLTYPPASSATSTASITTRSRLRRPSSMAAKSTLRRAAASARRVLRQLRRRGRKYAANVIRGRPERLPAVFNASFDSL